MPRPSLPAKQRVSKIIGVRVTPAEYKAFERAAAKAKLSISNVLRKKLGLSKGDK